MTIISTSTYFVLKNNNEKEEDIIIDLSKDDEQVKEEKESTEVIEYRVDIKGEIIAPGIYTLEEGSRVIDVINKAGGLTTNGDTTVINLSKKITDEMVIIIYSKNQVSEFSKTKEIEVQVQENCIQPTQDDLQNDACITTDETKNIGLISINNASLEELIKIPNIGESKAQDIINYREENNGFKAIEEIMNVSGIGEATFAKIKDYITI